MNDIALAQLTTATTNTGKVVVKMYKEQSAQRTKLDELAIMVDELATKQQSIDVEPIVSNLDVMRAEQVEAIEGVVNVVKPLLGAHADARDSLMGELGVIRGILEKHEVVMQKLIQTLGVMSDKLIQLDGLKHDVVELKDTNAETSSRVKTLGIQLSSMMVSGDTTEDELIALMTESNAILEDAE